jgi:hypothetical protein
MDQRKKRMKKMACPMNFAIWEAIRENLGGDDCEFFETPLGHYLWTHEDINPKIVSLSEEVSSLVLDLVSEFQKVEKALATDDFTEFKDGDDHLTALAVIAKSDKELLNRQMTPGEVEAQKRSWVYGTSKLANEHVTREMVDEVGDNLKNEKKETLTKDKKKFSKST